MAEILSFSHFDEINSSSSIWKWPDFSPKEMACRGSGKLKIDVEFMTKLQDLRYACGFPFRITSGYRSPKYNSLVSGTGMTGPHTTGKAVDIAVSRTQAFIVLQNCFIYGFTGIGVSQKGSSRFIHLDTLPGDKILRPTIWSY